MKVLFGMALAPMVAELLSQIRPDQKSASVTADGACDARKCHDAIAECGAHAVIPPCKNAKPWKPDSAPERLLATRPCAHQGASVGPSGDA